MAILVKLYKYSDGIASSIENLYSLSLSLSLTLSLIPPLSSSSSSLVLPEILPPTLSPSDNQFIGVNSSNNVTYTCTATDSDVVAWVYGVVGSLDNTNDGIYTDPPPGTYSETSTITFTQTTWVAALANNIDRIVVTCHSAFELEGTVSISTASPTYEIFIVCKYKFELILKLL